MANSSGGNLRQASQIGGAWILLLLLVFLASRFSPYPLEIYGVRPRTLQGLRGVLFMPLLHANFAHLLANAGPLFILLTLLFCDRRYRPRTTLLLIWIASGLGTWIIGRGGLWGGAEIVHIGASGLIFGLVTYFIVAGFLMRSWRQALVAILVLVIFGGIYLGVLPQTGLISWEGHLSGAIAGAWVARNNHG